MRIKKLFVLFFVLFATYSGNAQAKKYILHTVAFYNFENLFDTINDPKVEDEDFLPSGSNNWSSERYTKKIHNLSKVISMIAIDSVTEGLSVIGLCEIENVSVLNDLVNSENLKHRKYKIVYFDGPDARGIDPALLYNPKHFSIKNTALHAVKLVTDSLHKTRNQLVVSGLFDGEDVCFIVNHWPSRRGGEKETSPNRIAAAIVTKHIVDSLQKKQPKIKIIVMGDFNDGAKDESIKKYLNTSNDIQKLENNQLFNTMALLTNEGRGTISYKDNWFLFDQFIISKSLTSNEKNKLIYLSSHIFDNSLVLVSEGKYKGQPARTLPSKRRGHRNVASTAPSGNGGIMPPASPIMLLKSSISRTLARAGPAPTKCRRPTCARMPNTNARW